MSRPSYTSGTLVPGHPWTPLGRPGDSLGTGEEQPPHPGRGHWDTLMYKVSRVPVSQLYSPPTHMGGRKKTSGTMSVPQECVRTEQSADSITADALRPREPLLATPRNLRYPLWAVCRGSVFNPRFNC